jgi:OOP family OmpA-OmpF porin
MKPLLSLFVMVFSLVCCSAVNAREVSQQTYSISNRSQSVNDDKAIKSWYVGVKAGLLNGGSACEAHATSCDNNTASVGGYVGYVVNEWLALEGGYDYLGDISADYPALNAPSMSAPYKGEMKGIELVAKPYLAVNDSLALFAKVGTLAWDMHVTGQEIGYVHTADDNGWSSLVGVGFEYAWHRNWSTALEYQWINNVGGEATGGSDLNMFNLAVSYRFISDSAALPPTPLSKSISLIPAQTVHKESMSSITGAPFASASSQLSFELQHTLMSVVKRLREYPQATLLVKTHTDSRGSSEFNQRLSDKRAQMIHDFIVGQGIAPARLRATGYGETQPIADNGTYAGRNKNRRVEFVIPAFEVTTTVIPQL